MSEMKGTILLLGAAGFIGQHIAIALRDTGYTVLFGTGMGTAFQMVWAWRTGRVETIHSVASGVVVADWISPPPPASSNLSPATF